MWLTTACHPTTELTPRAIFVLSDTISAHCQHFTLRNESNDIDSGKLLVSSAGPRSFLLQACTGDGVSPAPSLRPWEVSCWSRRFRLAAWPWAESASCFGPTRRPHAVRFVGNRLVSSLKKFRRHLPRVRAEGEGYRLRLSHGWPVGGEDVTSLCPTVTPRLDPAGRTRAHTEARKQDRSVGEDLEGSRWRSPG
jgi:hypothetical protein